MSSIYFFFLCIINGCCSHNELTLLIFRIKKKKKYGEIAVEAFVIKNDQVNAIYYFYSLYYIPLCLNRNSMDGKVDCIWKVYFVLAIETLYIIL